MSAPERIWANEGLEWHSFDCSDVKAGWTHPYILATPAALAASPEVAKLVAEAEARGASEAYRKACVAVQIVISRNTPENGGDADPCLIDQLEAVESLVKREAAAIRSEATK